MLKAPGVLLHQGLLTLRGTCDGIAGNGGRKEGEGLFTLLLFYLFTFLPLKVPFRYSTTIGLYLGTNAFMMHQPTR